MRKENPNAIVKSIAFNMDFRSVNREEKNGRSGKRGAGHLP